jgi:hypothetical protein
MKRFWRKHRLVTKTLVTKGQRWARSFKFKNFEASKPLLRSITKVVSEKVAMTLPELVCDFESVQKYNPFIKLLFWNIYIEI